ncbi:PREDICTED: transcription elongation factor B polypeptide 3-like isoform X2 [Polistes dominula]|uniref:Transcription elongation factor B polypeptide 3-like isoform X2 n=1 Tax=Polistes dominula TaxID=743375 RepID=A0ABM1ICM8_POLDO|nr:PREDICTED: transcription elongation factor B polypeptide 3-like isoform X2 [Polistes dominula]
MSSVVEKIRHCQRNIKKYSDKEEKMLHYIQRLYNLPVTVQHLQDTGVGRTVNGLRKYEGGVGDASRALVAKWKAMVADEETSEGEDDEACVPDVSECYDRPESPMLKKKQEADSTVKISRHEEKVDKNEISEHSSKHSNKHDIKGKSENESNVNKESSKTLKHESQKEKHDKSHSKHESRDNKRSYSNDPKSSSSSSSTHVKKSTDKSSSHSNKLDSTTDKQDEYNKKRKLDNCNSGKKKYKKPKLSENESDDDRTSSYNTDKQNVNDFQTELNKKTHIEVKQEDVNKVESKKDKSKSREKVKSSSSSKEEKVHDDKSKKKSEESKEKQKTDSHRSSKSSKSKSHHSSSSSRDHAKDKDKDKDKAKDKDKDKDKDKGKDRDKDKDKDKSKRKENEERRHKHQSKSSSDSKESKSDSKESKSGSKESKEKVKIKQEINGDEGIDCNSGASFAEALGMCTVAPGSKRRHNNSPNLNSSKGFKSETNVSSTLNNKKQSSTKPEATSSDSLNPLPLLASNVKLEPLSVNLASTLPEISPNYKPLSYINPVHRKEEDKTLTDVIHVKNQRTKVYSGNKTGYTSVPSLYEICIRVLIENIDALEFTGGVPYDIIKPVLERATADQLYMLEHHNPYLIEDTDSLWQFHCNREFRNKQRQEMESWREMYMRCLDEREEKLKTLTANIKQSIDKTVPLRSAKLAYVDNVVKPPRNILKKQAKYGTNSIPTSTSDLKKKLIVGGGPNAATNISVPPPPMNRVKPSCKLNYMIKTFVH